MMGDSQEHYWGCELTKEKPTYTWSHEEEEDDSDYLLHTLFLKHAVLGTSAVKSERNVVQIETKNFEKKDVKQTFLSLTLGQFDMCQLDVSFGPETPATLRLVEGEGPVCISGLQLSEFPPDEELSQDESALDVEEDELVEDDEKKDSSKKRKAGKQPPAKAKKGKMDESVSSADDSMEDEEEEDEDEDDSEEDMDDEDDDESASSPEKTKKSKKAKDGKAKKASKVAKVPAKKAVVKKAKKVGKK